MPRENHRQFSRPSKSSARSRQTAKSHSQSQDGTKSNQPSALLFVDVSGPKESKRPGRRKAVRSFLMKQYKQSQKISDPLQIPPVELGDECDNVNNAQVTSAATSPPLAENDADSSHSSSQVSNHRHDAEKVFLASRQLCVSSPNSEKAAYPNSPLSFLGNGSLDPFDSYPARIEIRAHQLLDLCRSMTVL